MSEEPTLFPVSLVWTGERTGKLSVDGKPVIRTGTSSSDLEEANYHSPEDLFVASAAVCYMNGFVNFTRKMHIEFKAFTCDAVGTLEKVGRSFEITKIQMRARVQIESEELRDKIDRALELADKYCFVGNSMKCPISHEIEIVVL
jgi:organic hydroperoxide reductase OsmC/OhrA